MRRSPFFILTLMLIGGCLSTSPIIPPKYQLSVPSANASTISTQGLVLIGSSATEKLAVDGNTYTISWFAITNCNDTDTERAEAIAANLILATNVWPKFRQHMDLSVDGGSTWVRRIGYGLQTPRGATGSEFTWSPPDDYSLLTTRAVLRLVDLDGRVFQGPTNGVPYDVPTGGIRSATFAIAGAVIDAPAEGATLYPDTPATITWRQIGGGDQADLYWLTPTTNSFMLTFSNVVNGLNSREIIVPADLPIVAEMRFCIRGVEYPAILGYSGTFDVQP